MSLQRLCVGTLFRCSHCTDGASPEGFPLCGQCLNCLKSSRFLPFELGDPVDSGWAMYLLNEENYALLKSWKKYRGPLFDRRVIDPERLALARSGLGMQAEAIVPVPQDPVRSLRLGGSPAVVLARELGSLLALPVTDLLKKRPRFLERRQAELDLLNRLLNPMRFEVKPSFHVPRSVILVDDFITTGHTVREAARALKLGGVRRVGVIGLGARCAQSEKEPHLLKGA